MKPYLQPSCVVRVWSLLAWLAIATGSAWAQNNCGVSVDFSYVGKDTIQQQPLTERCIYRVTLFKREMTSSRSELNRKTQAQLR
jgi:hypothetical protein